LRMGFAAASFLMIMMMLLLMLPLFASVFLMYHSIRACPSYYAVLIDHYPYRIGVHRHRIHTGRRCFLFPLVVDPLLPVCLS
jgi:hypothetical protein